MDFLYLSSSISVFYILSVFYYNNLHFELQWFFYISTFRPYFLLYSAVINAPLPFPAWIMINLSDQLLIRRFLLGKVYLDGGVPGGYSDSSRPFSCAYLSCCIFRAFSTFVRNSSEEAPDFWSAIAKKSTGWTSFCISIRSMIGPEIFPLYLMIS